MNSIYAQTIISAEEIQHKLKKFTGTESYTELGNVLLTDGVRYLALAAKAFWLMYAISSHASYISEDFLIATFSMTQDASGAKSGVLIIEDEDGEVRAHQAFGHTDFPLESITIRLRKNNEDWILMLPSED